MKSNSGVNFFLQNQRNLKLIYLDIDQGRGLRPNCFNINIKIKFFTHITADRAPNFKIIHKKCNEKRKVLCRKLVVVPNPKN